MSKKTRRAVRRASYERTPIQDNIIDINKYRRSRRSQVEIIPRNVHQEDLLVALGDDSKHIVFAVGPAGCGKTLLATNMAIQALQSGQVDKIVITRPNVPVDDRDIGYLPGDVLSKMNPWMRPVLDIFEEHFGRKDIITLMEENILEPCPIAFIRGRTFKNTWIIVDEAQGTTVGSMKSILTRLGEGSKMVVTGDLDQSDLGDHNGLRDFLARMEGSGHSSLAVVRFTKSDVERHPVVKEVLGLYGE